MLFWFLVAGLPPLAYLAGLWSTAFVAREAFRRKRFTPHRDDPAILAGWVVVAIILWPISVTISAAVGILWLAILIPAIKLHSFVQGGYQQERRALSQLGEGVVDTVAFLKQTRGRKIAEDIDQWGGPRVLWMLNGIYQHAAKPRVLQVTCPTTAHVYLLPVQSTHQNCEEAWRWTGRLSPELTNLKIHES